MRRIESGVGAAIQRDCQSCALAFALCFYINGLPTRVRPVHTGIAHHASPCSFVSIGPPCAYRDRPIGLQTPIHVRMSALCIQGSPWGWPEVGELAFVRPVHTGIIRRLTLCDPLNAPCARRDYPGYKYRSATQPAFAQHTQGSSPLHICLQREP